MKIDSIKLELRLVCGAALMLMIFVASAADHHLNPKTRVVYEFDVLRRSGDCVEATAPLWTERCPREWVTQTQVRYE